jgi:predicted O-methyltransferase YrrM
MNHYIANKTLKFRHKIVKLIAPKLFADSFKLKDIMHDISNVPRPMTLFLKEYFKTKKDLICMEIGVASGLNALNMLQELPIKKIILIDPYTPYSDEGTVYTTLYAVEGPDIVKMTFEECFVMAKKRLSPFPQATFIRKTSDEAIADIHEQLDFIYIDGNHSYENVKRDIVNYFPLIKRNGVIGGHDYVPPFQLKGLVKAVNEFADEYGRLNFHAVCPDWWVVKDSCSR